IAVPARAKGEAISRSCYSVGGIDVVPTVGISKMLHLRTKPVFEVSSGACRFLNHSFFGFIREQRMSSGMGADGHSCALHFFEHFPIQRGQPIVPVVSESKTRLEYLNHPMGLCLGHGVEQRSHNRQRI